MAVRALLRAVAVALAVGGGAARAGEIDCAGTTGAGADNPLACRIFDVDGKEMPRTALVGRMARATYVLLGEVHDNPDIHRERARLIGEGAGHAPKAALVFEHIREEQQGVLEAFQARRAAGPAGDAGEAADELLAALDWAKSGWPDAAMFKPLFVEALRGGHAIYAGDAARADVRRISKEGAAAFTSGERPWLKVDDGLPPPLEDALLSELEASHCGLMPKTAFGNMALAQRYKDTHLAVALVEAARAHGRAVLLAGNGHVRSDRAVPYQLRRLVKDPQVLVVEFLEVEDGKTEAADYVPRTPDGAAAADVVVLMPRAERKDPCEEMRKAFRR